jgi:phytoene dehydrogenase-like protein
MAGRDPDLTTQSLGGDAESWRRLFSASVRNFEDLIDEVFQPVGHVPRHPITLGKFGIRAGLPATATVRRFHDEPAKALFMGVAAHAFSKLDGPLSSSVGMMLTAAAHAVGWPVAEGGTEAIARALLAELSGLGGKVVTGARVRSLDQLRDLIGVKPDVVILDTAPAGVLEIVGDALPGRVRRALTRFSYGPAAFKVDFAIEGDIPWTNENCRRAGTVHLGGSAPEIAHIEAATVRGDMPDRPFVLLGQQYLIDPSRSSSEANPIYAYAHVPHGYAGNATEAVVAQIERFAPGFQDQIVAVSTRNPAELEAYNANYVGGDISAGANTTRQIVLRPRLAANPYTLGVPGIYLCSSATPPGAGVHGMGGFHAAETALSNLD